MFQHLPGDTADIFDGGGDSVVHQCPRLGGQYQVLGCTRSGAPVHPFIDEARRGAVTGATALHQIDGVMRDVFGDRYARHQILQFEDAVGVHHHFQFRFVTGGGGQGDFHFLIPCRVIDINDEHEPVQLRFGKRVGAFVLDRILRGEHQKRLVQCVGFGTDGDLLFLHGLQESRLRFGRGAVDLVCQNDVGKNRAFDKPELAVFGGLVFVENFRAGDIRRHQVGRELDSAELEVEDFREGVDEQSFREAGNADEQAVPAREQGDQ